jgi:CBS domain containing-hemolysin-like protein
MSIKVDDVLKGNVSLLTTEQQAAVLSELKKRLFVPHTIAALGLLEELRQSDNRFTFKREKNHER